MEKNQPSKPLWGKWPGPPGCTCDFTNRPRDTCTKGGWIRCLGAMNLHAAQLKYRDEVGETGGPHEAAVVLVARP